MPLHRRPDGLFIHIHGRGKDMVTRYRKHRIMHAAVEHNGMIFVGGHAASDISVGMKEQTQQICEKLDNVLAECGSEKHNFCRPAFT